jgi:hypothetical protein
VSKAANQAADAFGDVLAAGLQARGGGAQLPAQASVTMEVELSPAERLIALEARIQGSLDRYQASLRDLQARHRAEVGELLGEIAYDKDLLHAAGYEKFGHYVKGRWGWDRSYGYRLIDLAVVRRALAPLGPAVVEGVVEAHARELAPVVKHNGDGAARDFVQVLREEAGGAPVTAAVIRLRRDQHGLGRVQSPIGDSGEDAGDGEAEVVDAELVDDDDTAERVNREIRSAADTAERALRQLEEALDRGVQPFHAADAARDLSRIRSAAVRLQRRADPGGA